jgi:hypothetical protein
MKVLVCAVAVWVSAELLDTKTCVLAWYTFVVSRVSPTPSAMPTMVTARIRAQLLRKTRT